MNIVIPNMNIANPGEAFRINKQDAMRDVPWSRPCKDVDTISASDLVNAMTIDLLPSPLE